MSITLLAVGKLHSMNMTMLRELEGESPGMMASYLKMIRSVE